MASAKELEWIDVYLDTGDAVLATRQIFPKTGQESKNPDRIIGSRSRQLKADLHAEIDRRSRELYGKDAPEIMSRLKYLALHAESEAVSAKCCSDWLSRAGHDAAQVIKYEDNRTEQELLAKLGTLIDKLDQDTIKALPESVKQKLKLVA